ncbi:plasmid mobilization protein [Dyadobacter sp. OTU695]|uniref:plasmid mobilization protein n=1 Tax=Dyadobacter sp. OTU695 TaxID=3043860 RepID=UPI00313C258A
MKNQKIKGRPPKEKGAAKREHFSVWVSADQKRQINEMIEKSGLSASQYFLTLALDIPFKKPQKRSLPKATADTIRILEQLAGILSLAVLKTRGQEMLSAQWQQSSQRVRLLADLITLWVFESFELRGMKQTLAALHSWLNDLAVLLSGFPADLESRQQLIDQCRSNARLVGDILHKYEAYYLAPLSELEPAWKAAVPDKTLVHQEIENALSSVLKRIKT